MKRYIIASPNISQKMNGFTQTMHLAIGYENSDRGKFNLLGDSVDCITRDEHLDMMKKSENKIWLSAARACDGRTLEEVKALFVKAFEETK